MNYKTNFRDTITTIGGPKPEAMFVGKIGGADTMKVIPIRGRVYEAQAGDKSKFHMTARWNFLLKLQNFFLHPVIKNQASKVSDPHIPPCGIFP
jgi:hypothetical protein